MDPLEALLEPQTNRAREQPVLGLVTARVRSIEDDGSYRLDYLTMGSGEPSAPARVMMPMAGDRRGMHFFPEPGDEVVVAFEHGNTNLPVILGAVWNNQSPPPDQARQSPDNNIRTVVSRSGHELTFDDTPGAQKVLLRTQGGHEITLDDTPPGRVSVKSGGGHELTLDDTPPGSAGLKTAGGVEVALSDAGGLLRLVAPGLLQIQCGGVMTLQANAINLTTTGVVTGSAVVIDGKPFGVHQHVPPVVPTPPPPKTGPVSPV